MNTFIRLLALVVPLLSLPSDVWAQWCYTANQSVSYSRMFNDDTGTAVDPTTPTALLRIKEDGSGTETFSAPTAPVKLNNETGWYGGAYTVAASPPIGTYELFVKGVVPTSKTIKMLAAKFVVRASCPATQASVDAVDDFVDTEITELRDRLPAALVSGRIDSSVGAYASGQAPIGTSGNPTLDAAEIAAGTGRPAVLVATTTCDISAATSATTFTLASCTSELGEAITLTDAMFEGRLIRAYTNGAAACNVVTQGTYVDDQTSGVVTAKTTIGATPAPRFSTTPSTANCGVRID